MMNDQGRQKSKRQNPLAAGEARKIAFLPCPRLDRENINFDSPGLSAEEALISASAVPRGNHANGTSEAA